MQINKINSNNINLYFGKTHKITSNNNLKEENKSNNKKKILLTLGALALAGAVAVSYKNPKVKGQINILKEKINSGLEGLKQNKKAEAACAAGVASVIGAVAVNERNSNVDETAVKINPSPVDEEETNQTEDAVEIVPVAADEPEQDAQPIEIVSVDDEKPAQHEESIEIVPIAEEQSEQTEQSPQIVPIVEEEPENAEQVKNENAQANDDGIKNPSDYMSIDEFKKSHGYFIGGKAYVADKPFTGNFAIQTDENLTVLNYENGKLKSAEISNVNSDGLYSIEKIKTYIDGKNGKQIIKTETRQVTPISEKNSPIQWHTDTISEIDDSEIAITHKDIFNQELSTVFKKQKNGKWKGFYEDRQFDYYRGFYILPRDVQTGEILTPRQYKKFFAK